jgi:hypothetical protein
MRWRLPATVPSDYFATCEWVSPAILRSSYTTMFCLCSSQLNRETAALSPNLPRMWGLMVRALLRSWALSYDMYRSLRETMKKLARNGQAPSPV